MPTLFIILGFIFKFYSNDHEPIHVHVEKGDAEAKFFLEPLKMDHNYGFSPAELKAIKKIIREKKDEIKSEWMKRFNKTT